MVDTISISSHANETANRVTEGSFPMSLAAPTGWRSEIVSEFDENFLQEFSQTNFETSFVDSTNENIDETFRANDFSNLFRENQKPPLVIHKKLPNNLVTYKQNVSLRYLRPPTPPPPGPLIIREVRPPPPPPQSPIKIRQRPPAPKTPPPLVFREKPPPPPDPIPPKVVEKLVPASAAQPAAVIVERFDPPPAKPADIIIERWLPYKKPPPRKIFIERAPPIENEETEGDVLIRYAAPRRRVCREFINQGVFYADPCDYRRTTRQVTVYDDDDYPTSRYCHSRDLDYFPPCRDFYRPSRYCEDYRPFYSRPIETIRVKSENEFRRVICDLTDGRFEPSRCVY